MPEAQLTGLFWELLDHLAYAVMDARLWLFDLMHGPEPPTPADEKREADRKGLGALAGIDFGVLMAAADKEPNSELDRG
jgi:hypothetical protein